MNGQNFIALFHNLRPKNSSSDQGGGGGSKPHFAGLIFEIFFYINLRFSAGR